MPKGKPKLKTEVITLRVEPRVKSAAEAAAKKAHRSLTNFIEVLVIDHCESVGINPDECYAKGTVRAESDETAE